MEVWHVRFCCIRCREGTLWMEWPILHGSRCLVGSIRWDFSGKHPFHFSIYTFHSLFFFSPLFSLQFLPWFAWKQCFRRFGFSTNAWEHHVIIMPVASRNRSIGRATHKVLSPLSTVVLVEPRQTCHLTTFALKVYGQIGHWSGTQWGEVKKVFCRCPDVLFTWQFTCNRIRSWVKQRHFQYAMLFMPANCNDIECKVCPFPMTQVMYGHVDVQWLCIEHYRTTQWGPVTFQFHCPLVRRKPPTFPTSLVWECFKLRVRFHVIQSCWSNQIEIPLGR